VCVKGIKGVKEGREDIKEGYQGRKEGSKQGRKGCIRMHVVRNRRKEISG
jgi:hypothetical protein